HRCALVQHHVQLVHVWKYLCGRTCVDHPVRDLPEEQQLSRNSHEGTHPGPWKIPLRVLHLLDLPLVLAIHADMVREYSGRNRILQAKGRRSLQWYFLDDADNKLRCSIAHFNARRIKEKLYHDGVHDNAPDIWSLAQLLPDGIPESDD